MPQLDYLFAIRFTKRVARQLPLAGLDEILAPLVVYRRENPCSPEQIGNRSFTTKTLDNNADLFTGGVLFPGVIPDVAHNGLSGRFARFRFGHPFLLRYSV